MRNGSAKSTGKNLRFDSKQMTYEAGGVVRHRPFLLSAVSIYCRTVGVAPF